MLGALKMEEGAMSQDMQEALGAPKHKETVSFLQPPEGTES